MKKTLIPICLIACMAVISCKKEEKRASSTWNVDGTTYTAVSAVKNDNAYAFSSSSAASISFFFKTYPTSSGTYRINDDAVLDADEVNILFGTPSPLMVGRPTSTSTSTKVTVTVDGGKINIECLDVPVEKENGSGGVLGTGILSAVVYTDL